MTRSISPELTAHFGGELLTLAILWKLTRTDDTIMGFTNHDKDIVYDDVTYEAASAFTASAIKNNSSMAVDNLEVDGILDNEKITEPDLMAGLYDGAQVEVYLVNYEDLTQGALIMRTGTLGEFSIQKEMFTAEIRGLSQKIQQNIGRIVTPRCPAVLGDSKCTVDLSGFTFSGVVSSVTDNQTFNSSSLTQDAGYFKFGVIEWTGGSNAGLSMEVKSSPEVGLINLALPMPYNIEAGDEFNAVAGCNKAWTTCKDKFDNLVNFRGFPFVPGIGAIMTTAGTRKKT
jgi:uncharacterized phage protein (TIGR02218 family)